MLHELFELCHDIVLMLGVTGTYCMEMIIVRNNRAEIPLTVFSNMFCSWTTSGTRTMCIEKVPESSFQKQFLSDTKAFALGPGLPGASSVA